MTMLVTTKTIVSFDPVNEYEKMQSFKEEIDVSDWQVYESTVAITFIKTDTTEIKEAKQ